MTFQGVVVQTSCSRWDADETARLYLVVIASQVLTNRKDSPSLTLDGLSAEESKEFPLGAEIVFASTGTTATVTKVR